MGEVIVRLIDMEVPGVTVLDSDGNYNMYINARLSFEQQQKVYKHELRHITGGHFFDHKTVEENEREAG